MDYPHGHVSHHHHHHDNRLDDNENNPIYPPPPFTQSPFPPPPPHQTYPPPNYIYPPPPQQQVYPPPPSYGGAYNPTPYAPPPQHHSFHPHMPGFIGSHFRRDGPDDHGSSTHSSHGGGAVGPDLGLGLGLSHLENRPTHKIHCKAGGERYAVGIRDGKVVLTHPDHSDLSQHWYKDEKYSTKVKDKDSHPSFMLVNKGTRQAVKHSISCHPVQLAPYNPDVLDVSVLWTESSDLGSGFRTIRTVNNVHLVMDAWNADKDHGGIHDGTLIALYETWKGDNQNQQWKLVRHCK